MPKTNANEFDEVMKRRWRDLGIDIAKFQTHVFCGEPSKAAALRSDIHDAVDRLLDSINEQFKPG